MHDLRVLRNSHLFPSAENEDDATLNVPWKYNNIRNTIFFSVSNIFFILLITPVDSTNDQNICIELFKATFTH